MSYLFPTGRLRCLPPLLALLAVGGAVQVRPLEAFTPELPSLAAELAEAEAPPEGDWPARIDARLAGLGAAASDWPAIQPATDPAALDHALTDLARRGDQRAALGVSVRDLTTGAEIFGWESEAALNPASNAKLLTATAAVELLGPDYRFETRLARQGDALYLVGGGDPSLQVEDLEELARRVSPEDLAGVARLVVVDDMFSPERFGPGYDRGGSGPSYQAPSGALSLQFNTVEITAWPTRPGEPARIAVSPACDHVEVSGRVPTRRRGRLRARSEARGDRTHVTVYGSAAATGGPTRLRRRIHDPGLFTGTAFADVLQRAHAIPPLEVVRGRRVAEAETLAVHRSAPLVEVLASALKFSNNFTTEQVLRTLGHHATGAPGDWDNGTRVLARFWAAIGEDPSTLVLENAAGLSQEGRITARALTRLTQLWAARGEAAGQVLAALPIAGREGTLRGRLATTQGRVLAKTGTLQGASALTGVVMDTDGRPRLGFSILVNGDVSATASRRLQDRMVMALLDQVP